MEFTMRFTKCLPALISMIGLSGCSSQQLYGVGQAWQENECNKIVDMQERNRCMSGTATSYEDYKRQSDAAKGAR